ncbi:MAG: TIR domain-containing protein [Acidobacteriota bacterium]|nr:TIR domain-containing protein [Acidobacteriota bacterium]
MKVFISWSGKLSRQIACVFRDWLPSVIQSIKPYVSSEDIDKGIRWSSDIAVELEASNYGLIIVTKENVNAPWLNFEAGALSKAIDRVNVSPFLFDIKGSDVQNPLVQFQFTIFEKEDIRKLIHSINNRLDEQMKLNEGRLNESFERWWSDLQKKLQDLEKGNLPDGEKSGETGEDKQSKILEELLELVRNQQRILSSPENLLPEKHFEKVLGLFHEKDVYFISKIIKDHHELWKLAKEIRKDLEEAKNNNKEYDVDDFDGDMEIIIMAIDALGSEIREFEKQKYAKMRNNRIIPEF